MASRISSQILVELRGIRKEKSRNIKSGMVDGSSIIVAQIVVRKAELGSHLAMSGGCRWWLWTSAWEDLEG